MPTPTQSPPQIQNDLRSKHGLLNRLYRCATTTESGAPNTHEGSAASASSSRIDDDLPGAILDILLYQRSSESSLSQKERTTLRECQLLLRRFPEDRSLDDGNNDEDVDEDTEEAHLSAEKSDVLPPRPEPVLMDDATQPKRFFNDALRRLTHYRMKVFLGSVDCEFGGHVTPKLFEDKTRQDDLEAGLTPLQRPGGARVATEVMTFDFKTHYNTITRIRRSVAPFDFVTPPGVETRPRDHQKTGVMILKGILSSKMRGAILGDDMGLGKTFTSILLTQAIEGITVVVVPKALIPVWVTQLERHLTNPRYIVLEDNKITEFDIIDKGCKYILITPQRLVSQSKRLQNKKAFAAIRSVLGASTVNKLYPEASALRVNAPLYSGIWHDLGVPITVILDEAQSIKNQDSCNFRAVQGIPYDRIVFLSGTFMSNEWVDCWSMLCLMPGSPFPNRESFLGWLGLPKGIPSATLPAEAGQRLVDLLDSVTVSRPKSLIPLPKLTVHVKLFSNTESEVQGILASAMEYFKSVGIPSEDCQNSNAGAMAHVSRARMTAACAIMTNRTETPKTSYIKKEIEEYTRVNSKQLAACSISELLMFAKQPSKLGIKWTQVRQRREAPMIRQSRSSSTDARNGAENESDSDDDPEDLANESSNTDGTLRPEKRGGSRAAWLARLNDTDPLVYIKAPRVQAILDIINCEISDTARHQNGKVKIIIFSEYKKFLDILEHVINRWLPDAPIIRYDGSLTVPKRAKAIKDFASETTNHTFFLVTAKTGADGLDLTMSHTIILAEAWWSSGVEQQAISRCHRQCQEYPVRVWKVRSKNSVIDEVIHQRATMKQTGIRQIMQFVQRGDHAGPKPYDQNSFDNLNAKF